MKHILIDMDGVLNNFSEKVIYELYKLGYKYDFSFENEYHLEKGILNEDYTNIDFKKQREIMNTIMLNPTFWLTLKPLDRSITCVEWLNSNYEVTIATTPFRFDSTFKNVKIDWMKEHFKYIDKSQIVFSSDKWSLQGDVIIEDKPETLEKCKAKGITTLAFDHPYNKSTKVDYRIISWDLNEIKKIMEDIEKGENIE